MGIILLSINPTDSPPHVFFFFFLLPALMTSSSAGLEVLVPDEAALLLGDTNIPLNTV